MTHSFLASACPHWAQLTQAHHKVGLSHWPHFLARPDTAQELPEAELKVGPIRRPLGGREGEGARVVGSNKFTSPSKCIKINYASL